ncbi:MAG: PKD domain-containing protein, partial [Coriobacteriia bacterium]|nr:PKD domain-containing protein [Coriobacteriia bacterium]
DMGSFAYNDKLPGYGRFSSPNTLELGPSAGNVHYAGGLTIGGITFGGAEGIDCTAEVCAHELYHKWVYDQNQGPWGSMTHSDSDRLPDTYETDVSGTIIDNPDTHDVAGIKGYPPYHDYGDQEWMAMRAGNGEVGYPLKDWAYPGKQTQTSTTPAATSSVATITPVFVGSAAQAAATTTTTGFTGVFSDEGTDTNSNSLYDSLTVGVGVSAEHAGYYNVVGWLEDGIGTEVGLVNQLVYLDAGVQTCNLSFYGVRIHEVGSDGPYVLSVILATEDGEQYDTSLAAYTTATYSVSQFEGHQVYFEGTVTDQAQDANQDGLYEELTFAVTVIATTPGTYHLTAFLVASDGAPIYPLTTSSTLTSGVHMMTLSAPGTVIRQSGADGPYRLQSLGLFDGDTRTDFKYLAHTTQPYAYTDFEAGAAEFGPSTSFTDAGVDLNANWFFDVLRVELPTFVSQDGRYALFGRLFDDQGNLICEAFSEMELTAGTNTLVLDFPGEEIRVSGKAGPYLVRYAFLYDAEGSVADSLPAPYLTAAYACTEFDTPPAALTRQFDDRSIDTNADGIYEFLEVDVGVFAASAGTCALNARLMDKNGGEIAWAATTAYVSAGQPQMLTLVFDGPPIYNHGVNGPYLVRDLLFYSVSDPSLFDYMDDPYLTQSAWLVAENRPPVADAGPDQVVDATGPTGALVTLDGSASTDPDSTSGTNDDIVSFEWLENASLVAIGMQAQLAMPIGTHTVTLRVTDSQGEQDEDTVQITVRSQTVSVVIDIKPGGYPNSINLGSRGVIPVAILSSEDFDATQVDPATAELAGAGVAVGGKGDKYLSHQEDVDGDGLIDLILQVRTENLDPGQFDGGYACITAYTYGGINVRGCDEITIVPPE